MASRLSQAVHLPVFWGTRPPWTNNAGVSDATVGGDVPLLSGSTIQVACVYLQGQRFSRVYGVGYHDERGYHYTHHVTGALTRRLVLMHLMLGMDTDGNLLIHPELAPVQVAITLAGGDAHEQAQAQALSARLAQQGIRCELLNLSSRASIGRTHLRWKRQGVPLRIYLQPRRRQDDQNTGRGSQGRQ